MSIIGLLFGKKDNTKIYPCKKEGCQFTGTWRALGGHQKVHKKK